MSFCKNGELERTVSLGVFVDTEIGIVLAKIGQDAPEYETLKLSSERRLESTEATNTGQKVAAHDLWSLIAPIVRAAGLELFDLEVPTARAGVLRVFIWRPATAAISRADNSHNGNSETQEATVKGVSLQDCAIVSKRITAIFEAPETVSPDQSPLGLSGMGWDASDWSLEVSSPGINRRLNRPEHFSGAIGERVRVVVRSSGSREVRIVNKDGIASDNNAGENSAPNPTLTKLLKKGIFVGLLQQFDGNFLTLKEERSQQGLQIPLHTVSEARVDFLF